MAMRFRRQAGVALIEALIALAIMAFGMLAVVGMQATLRQNSDLSRQRAEAVRIAQQEIERVRAYLLLADPSGVNTNTFSLLNDRSEVLGPTPGSNAEYTLSTKVKEGAGVPSLAAGNPSVKTLQVDVDWVDRNGVAQNVRLSTTVHGVAPELAGTLSVPPNGFPTSTPGGRHVSIPWDAIPLGDGTSGFIPPQATGGTVAWLFNNATGLMQICTLVGPAQTATRVNFSNCSGRAQLLTGFVNFASNASTQATAADAMRPRGSPFLVEVKVERTAPSALSVDATNGCFTGTALAEGRSYIEYFCAVPVDPDPTQAPVWSGYAIVTSTSLPVVPVVGGFATCRYTHPNARTDPPGAVSNVQHPRAYTDVKGPLAGQDFLMVRVVTNNASDCPDGPPLPSTTTTFPQPQTAP
jgi:type II secretory pathway pseudopilin PulG